MQSVDGCAVYLSYIPLLSPVTLLVGFWLVDVGMGRHSFIFTHLQPTILICFLSCVLVVTFPHVGCTFDTFFLFQYLFVLLLPSRVLVFFKTTLVAS